MMGSSLSEFPPSQQSDKLVNEHNRHIQALTSPNLVTLHPTNDDTRNNEKKMAINEKYQ